MHFSSFMSRISLVEYLVSTSGSHGYGLGNVVPRKDWLRDDISRDEYARSFKYLFFSVKAMKMNEYPHLV